MYPPRFSIIIPAYNASLALEECLQAISRSCYRDYEIIIVNDHSSDTSVEIARRFSTTIFELEERKGVSYARNYGSRFAKGEVLLFIDSDVVARKDTLEKLDKVLMEYSDVDAVMGVYSQNQKNLNFCSQYKNYYVRYKVYKMPRLTSTPVSALLAVRKKAFILSGGFNTDLVTGEDIEFGQRFTKMGFKVLVDIDIEVVHNKYHSLYSALKDSLTKTVNLTHIAFNLRREIERKKGEKGVLSVNLRQQGGVAASAMSLLVLFLSPWYPSMIIWKLYLLILGAIVYLNIGFWEFCGREKGMLFAVQFFTFVYLEMIVSVLGILIAFLRILKGQTVGNFGKG